MHNHNNENTSSIEQKIFKIGLSVETISIYLLCCGLTDSGRPITNKNLIEIWNGNEVDLLEGLKHLDEKKILTKIISDRQENNVYKLNAIKKWKV